MKWRQDWHKFECSLPAVTQRLVFSSTLLSICFATLFSTDSYLLQVSRLCSGLDGELLNVIVVSNKTVWWQLYPSHESMQITVNWISSTHSPFGMINYLKNVNFPGKPSAIGYNQQKACVFQVVEKLSPQNTSVVGTDYICRKPQMPKAPFRT